MQLIKSLQAKLLPPCFCKLFVFQHTRRRQKVGIGTLATPMSYEVDAEQYVAIAVGGHDQLDLKRGD